MLDAGYLDDLFAGFGRVSVRRMFGGQGVFVSGLMVAIVIGDVLYVKADAESEARHRAAGCEPFRYVSRLKTGGTRTTTLSYWQVPEGAGDDADAFRPWASGAVAAAIRAGQAAEAARARRRARQRQPAADRAG